MLSTFAAVFVAEMGDKTQLATLGLASGASRWSVFIGAASALVATTAIAVLAADVINRAVPALWVRRGAGVLLVAIGAFYLVTKPDG